MIDMLPGSKAFVLLGSNTSPAPIFISPVRRDCVSGPLWPREVCDLLMASGNLTISGNHDRWVSGPDPSRMGASDRYAYSQLDADHRQWPGSLPPTADAGHNIFACHGTPTNDNRYLIEEVSERRLERAHPSAIQERLGDVHARVVLCGTVTSRT